MHLVYLELISVKYSYIRCGLLTTAHQGILLATSNGDNATNVHTTAPVPTHVCTHTPAGKLGHWKAVWLT